MNDTHKTDEIRMAIIGAGEMATALVDGWAKHLSHIQVSAPRQSVLDGIHDAFGVAISTDNRETVSQADVVVLAVRKHQLKAVLKEISDTLITRKPLILSMMAGVSCAQIQSQIGEAIPVVRCMPNLPVAMNHGATGLWTSEVTPQGAKDVAESLLRLLGVVVWVEQEDLLDVVTALSGSGPAYFLTLMRDLIDAAESEGLPRADARLLCFQTALGSARLALGSSHLLEEIIEKIRTKGGTTDAALNVLDEAGTHGVIVKAIAAAKNQARKMNENE